MIKTEKKLSIFLKTNNSQIPFDVSPKGTIQNISDIEFLYEIDININTVTTISINLNSKINDNDYLQINKIMLNNIELNHIDSFGIYKVNGKIKRTYGWMDEVGSYIIKVHSNAVSQNLLLFLLSKKNG